MALHFFSYEKGDVLIDSEGVIYALDKRETDCIKPRATGRSFNKEEILEIIKEDFSAIGERCVSKFSISTISKGVLLLVSSRKNNKCVNKYPSQAETR